MPTIKPDERGAVSIPPALLRQIGVPPESPVTIEVSGVSLVVRASLHPLPDVEIYTAERKAELLLNNAVDAVDYKATLAVVRSMGLDPDSIPHERPAGI